MQRTFLALSLALVLGGCTSASSLVDLGHACYMRGDYEGSLHHYRAARRKDPTLLEIDLKIRLAEVRLFIQRGDQAARSRLWQAAEREYQEALRLEPGNQEAAEGFRRIVAARAEERFLRGQELALAGDPHAAIQEFEQALELKPDHRRAAEALERARVQRDDHKRRAETAYQEGQRARAAGRHEEAAEHFQRALGLDPFQAAARRELEEVQGRIAEHLVRQGDELAEHKAWGRAAEAYRRAQERVPELPGLADRLRCAEHEARAERLVEEGNRAFDHGDWRTAFERFDEAFHLSQDRERFRVRHETARDQLAAAIEAEALSLERDGRLADCLGRYRAILAFHPRYRDLEARCERLERALSAYEAGCRAQTARDLARARDHFLSCRGAHPGFREAEVRLREVEAALARANHLHRLAQEAETRCEIEKARSLYEECLGVSRSHLDAEERFSRVSAAVRSLEEARKLERERRLVQALERYEELLKQYQALAEAQERSIEIGKSCRALEDRYRTLREAEKREKFQEALAAAREIRKDCVGFKDVDHRVNVLESEVDYADAAGHEAREDYAEAIRTLERVQKRTPGFRDVDERLRRHRQRGQRHDQDVRDRGRGEGRPRGEKAAGGAGD